MIFTFNEPFITREYDDYYKHLYVSITHRTQGINYGTYKQEKEGYYIHFSPCNYIKKEGYSMVEHSPLFNDFSFKIRIAGGKRTSKKKLDTLNNLAKIHEKDIVTAFETKDKQEIFITIKLIYKDFINEN